MKVFVTQGHEKGIGLEVFFKSCLMLNKQSLDLIQLLAYKDSVIKTLHSMSVLFELHENSIVISGQTISVIWLNDFFFSQSLTALNHAMKLCESGGVLFTLPTSKDQFQKHAGHTEYFRSFYKTPNLGMFFSSPQLQILLLTDHIPVKSLSKSITEKLIFDRISLSIQSLIKWDWPINRVLISGLNPHCGEGGLIGNEDHRIKDAINRLTKIYKLHMSGPIPGDTMILEKKTDEDILVYLFHDQGLGVFKALQGLIGSNITLGLPYPRFSPDHGTSFGLFGKNEADYRGCEFSLKQSVQLLKRLTYEKNSSYQSKSS